MDSKIIGRCLSDERCGLYFLAGLDETGSRGIGLQLTVHAAVGAFTSKQAEFLKSSIQGLDSDINVELRLHDRQHLTSPRSLESFLEGFVHECIVADPTGAFSRAHEMVELARSLRIALGASVSRILWVQERSELYILSASSDKSSESSLADPRTTATEILEKVTSASLKAAISSLTVSDKLPIANFTPVDEASVVEEVYQYSAATSFPRAVMLASIARMFTALVGLGTVVTANAALPPNGEEINASGPGISALVGLTTLGENSFGVRNHYRAIGGLRLFFGDTGPAIASVKGYGPQFHEPENTGIAPLIPVPGGGKKLEEPIRIVSPE